MYVIYKEKYPSIVKKIRISKTGKHGHSKTHITCKDIFTKKKYEMYIPSTHLVY